MAAFGKFQACYIISHFDSLFEPEKSPWRDFCECLEISLIILCIGGNESLIGFGLFFGFLFSHSVAPPIFYISIGCGLQKTRAQKRKDPNAAPNGTGKKANLKESPTEMPKAGWARGANGEVYQYCTHGLLLQS
jgi:hypothetical protein